MSCSALSAIARCDSSLGGNDLEQCCAAAIAAVIAAVPAIICRLLLNGFPGQIFPQPCFFWSSALNGGSTSGARALNDETNIPDGASFGIGLAIAKTLVAKGHEVWERLVMRKKFLSFKDFTHRTRIARPRFHCTELQSRLQQAGSFDVLINNAGTGHFSPPNRYLIRN